jgi:hypothetical protein
VTRTVTRLSRSSIDFDSFSTIVQSRPQAPAVDESPDAGWESQEDAAPVLAVVLFSSIPAPQHVPADG